MLLIMWTWTGQDYVLSLCLPWLENLDEVSSLAENAAFRIAEGTKVGSKIPSLIQDSLVGGCVRR